MAAIYALERPQRVKLLITRVRLPSGMRNGVALACMARLKQPGIKVLFTSFPEVRLYTDSVGEFLPRPLSTDELLETVGTMLNAHPNRLPGSYCRPFYTTNRPAKGPYRTLTPRSQTATVIATAKRSGLLPRREAIAHLAWKPTSVTVVPRGQAKTMLQRFRYH